MVVDKDKIEEVTRTLNDGQLAAFNMLVRFIEGEDDNLFTLSGYAGTGKTYVISRFLEAIGGDTVASAPTNKAVKVLSQMGFDSKKIKYSTIHKLLALKVTTWYPPKGSKAKPKQVLRKNRYASPTVHLYDVVIIDEVSMLSDEIFLLVNAIIKGTDTKVIFMGDQAQIPPVGKDDALPLIEHKEQGEFILSIYREEIENEKTKKPMVKFHKRAYPIDQEIKQTLIFEDGMFTHEAELLVNIPYYTLTQSMRQKADSGILKTANSIRDRRWTYDNAIADRQQMHDLFFYSSSSPIDKLSFMGEMFKLFKSNAFTKDSDYVKVLAWRNKTVSGLSTVIRKQIFKGQRLQRFMIGEKLIASNPIIQGSNIIFNTSDEFTVTAMKIDRETYEYPLTEEQKNKKLDNEIQETLGDVLTIKDTGTTKDTELAFWSLSVKSTLPNEEDEDIVIEETIKVLHESSDKAYKKLLSRYAYIEDWKGWGRLKDTYANVAYNYCITVHKAQGSSYKNVFVIEDDIDANFKTLEKNRIKYTAVSRASEALHILTRHI